MKNKILLGACGILKKEIKWLIEKNQWPVDTTFFNSALHVDFERLSKSLSGFLLKNKERDTIIFYGTCHPLMDKILGELKTFRTPCQNCVDILLGNELFMEELVKGAYFLFEDWAKRWDYIIAKTFGKNQQIIQDIFQGDRKYLLGLRTPCSGDFKNQAEEASKKIGLPLYWMDVSLDNLEKVLGETLSRKMGEAKWRKG